MRPLRFLMPRNHSVCRVHAAFLLLEAKEAVEVIETIEVIEAVEVIEAPEVSNAREITQYVKCRLFVIFRGQRGC